jgi:HEAT repeat protein
VHDLVGYLYKAVKTILLYPPTNPLPGEFKLNLHEKLTKFLDEHGPLTLQVRGDQFVYAGETVHEEAGGDDNFIATLTRDGVQKITFLPGLEFEELERFLAIVKKVINERNEDDDLVTLLWEASFESIKYEAIAELDSIDYEALEKQLLSRPVETEEEQVDYGAIVLEETEEAPAAEAATSKSIETVDISKILGDVDALADDLTQVDTYLREATQFDPALSTIGILFEILIGDSEIPEFRETCNILDNLYDRLIQQADFSSALRIYVGLVELEQTERDQSPARAKRLEESKLRAGDKVRLEQLTRSLNEHPGCDVESCRSLLSGLPIEILPHLVSALGDLEHYPTRKLVCDILAERASDRIDLIGNGIFDKRWYVVRNVAIILGNIGGARACNYLDKAVKHADERVRREVVEALVRMDPSESNRTLRNVLEDTSFELRLLALRALAHRRDVVTGEMVEAHVREASFVHLEPSEQKEWLSTLAHIKGDEALPTFRKLIGGWAFFDRAARHRLRALAVLALSEAGGPQTADYLDKLARHKDGNVREGAGRALSKLRSGKTIA